MEKFKLLLIKHIIREQIIVVKLQMNLQLLMSLKECLLIKIAYLEAKELQLKSSEKTTSTIELKENHLRNLVSINNFDYKLLNKMNFI